MRSVKIFAGTMLLGCVVSITAQTDSAAAPPQVQQPALDKPARISGAIIAGQLLTHQNPIYPAEAKAKGISGTVVMRAIIDKDGKIDNLVPISGPELLQQASIDAVRHWTYRPYTLNGQPTEVQTTITVNFNLNTPLPDHPLQISNDVMAGLLISHKNPECPALSKTVDCSGSVILRALIGKDGLVKELEAISGPDMLKQAAIDAARQWKYHSYLLNGQPMEISTTITVNFPPR